MQEIFLRRNHTRDISEIFFCIIEISRFRNPKSWELRAQRAPVQRGNGNRRRQMMRHLKIFSNCHNLTLGVYIFNLVRFHADDIPYSSRHVGSFRRWRRRGRVRHHLAVESGTNTNFRGDFCVFDVLWGIKMLILVNFYPTITKILHIVE